MTTNIKSLRALCMLAVMAAIISFVAAAPTRSLSSVILKRETGSQGVPISALVRRNKTESTGASGHATSKSTGGKTTTSNACSVKHGKRGLNDCPVTLELAEDTATEDPDPSQPAHVWAGQATDGIEKENPEDYNEQDLAEAEKAFSTKHETRSLYKRYPTDFRSIKSADTTLTYVKAFLNQDTKKQIIFYSKMEGKKLKFYKSTHDKWIPDPKNKIQIEHILEIQRIKSYFKRAKPQGVTDAAWKMMQTAVDDDINSDDNPAKEKLGSILNAVGNLRGFQARPNLLKGKVCTYTDKTRSGLATTSKGPNWKEIWSRGEAWTAQQYLKDTTPQYKLSAKTICASVKALTEDEKLASLLETELLAMLEKDKATLKEQLDKDIGKPGDVFAEEDMPA